MLQGGELAGLRCRRVGSWRILYEIEGDYLVDILVFADRKNAYE
jgi:mRNA-degrading endonuclease RelE of RelBE toxin-antitoxin system